jgi:hypothetical protein
LEKVYSYLRESYKDKYPITICNGYPNYNSDDSCEYHTAAFDSYVTVASFIWMFEELGVDCIKAHSNRLNQMRSIYSCFNIGGQEPYLCPNVKQRI